MIFHTRLGEQQQLLRFLKNLAILGGLLLVMVDGTGPLSLDQRQQRSAPAAVSFAGTTE